MEATETKYTVRCATCGKECKVSFKPTSGKPIYCLDCFKDRHKDDRLVRIPFELSQQLCAAYLAEYPDSFLKATHPKIFNGYVLQILTNHCKKLDVQTCSDKSKSTLNDFLDPQTKEANKPVEVTPEMIDAVKKILDNKL